MSLVLLGINSQLIATNLVFFIGAEGVGFEPTRACALPVFKTGAINHSTTPPKFRAVGDFAITAAMINSEPELSRRVVKIVERFS